MGFGFGSSSSIDLFADQLDRTGTAIGVEAQVNMGPLSGGANAVLDDCGELKTGAKVCLGPACVKNDGVSVEVDPDDIGKTISQVAGKTGVGAQVKLTGTACGALRW